MKPYNKSFLIEKIDEYNNLISKGKCGEFRITKNIVPKEKIYGYMYKNTEEYNVEIVELLKGETSIMRLDPREIEGSYEAIKFASGKVGIVGLGVGYVAQEMAKKKDVTEVIVYEMSQEIIDLYLENFGENEKITIIQDDAFKAKRQEFDFFYVDIYNYKIVVKMASDYRKFHKIHKITDYSFFGMEHFLLSCKFEDLLWVFVPETWVAMCKDTYEKLQRSGYLEKYVPLAENKVEKMLVKFKEVLNEGMSY